MRPRSRTCLCLLMLACGHVARGQQPVEPLVPESITILVDGEAHAVDDAWLENGQLWLPAGRARLVHGLALTPEGLRRGDDLLATPAEAGLTLEREGRRWINASRIALTLGQAVVVDVEDRVWSFAQPARFRPGLAESLVAPDVTLPDRTGKPVSLSDMRGKKVLLLTWASW